MLGQYPNATMLVNTAQIENLKCSLEHYVDMCTNTLQRVDTCFPMSKSQGSNIEAELWKSLFLCKLESIPVPDIDMVLNVGRAY